ncbi:hypothetical protein [Streptomyces sp. 900105245]
MNQLHASAVDLQGDIASECLHFNGDLKTFSRLAFGNSALVATGNITQMNDYDYKGLISLVTNMPIQGITPDLRMLFSNQSSTLLRAAANLENLTQSSVGFSMAPSGFGGELGQGLEEAINLLINPVEVLEKDALLDIAEESVVDIFEEMSFASLGALGVGVFLAVGIEVILSALEGEQEAAALDSEINRLNDAIGKSRTYFDTIVDKRGKLQGSIVTEEKRFIGLTQAISSVGTSKGAPTIEPDFTYPSEPTFQQAANFAGAVQGAVDQYGIFVRLRELWDKYCVKQKQSGDSPSRSQFLLGASILEHESVEVIDQYFSTLSRYSDTMANASP